MKRHHLLRRIPTPVIVVLLTVLVASSASARPPQTDGERLVPQLGGHDFTPTWIVPDPFVRTYVRNTLGMGKAMDVYFPLFEIDGEPAVGLTGDILVAVLDFEYQHAIRDWVAVRARIRVTGRLGNDVQSLLGSGVTAATGFEFGWLIRLFEKERTMLSGTLEVSNRSFTLLDVANWVDGIVEGKNIPLVTNTPSTRGGAGLAFAWGISRPFGLVLNGQLGYGESVNRDRDNEVYGRVGGALSFDLYAISPVPLGLVGGVHWDSFPEGGEDVSEELVGTFLRVAYNGRSDFLVALDTTLETADLGTFRENVKMGSMMISLRYYF